MKKLLTILLVCFALAVAGAGQVQAKDYKFMPSVDIGGLWWFLYDTDAKSITVDPNIAYGATLTQIVDFSWARNMAFELSYLHAKNRGEWDRLEGESFLFDLTSDYGAANISYFFEGRWIHPYISAGVGAMNLKYQTLANSKVWETDLALNAGAGVDFTLFAPKAGIEQINVGMRIRYVYVNYQRIVNTGMNALVPIFRFQIRF